MTRKLSLRSRARIYQALKRAGHWYIVGVHNWEHPANKVPNCLAITLDGFVQCKFTLLPNGWLSLAEIRSQRYISFPNVVLGDCFTITALVTHLLTHPATQFGQAISLQDAQRAIQGKAV